MKIELSTNLIKDNNLSDDCKLLIENGKIQKISFTQRQLYNTYKIYKPTIFQLEILSSIHDYRVGFNFNYKIIFTNGSDEQVSIPLKLTSFQRIKLNCIQQKYWIQKTDNWVKLIIPIITSIITTYITYLFLH